MSGQRARYLGVAVVVNGGWFAGLVLVSTDFFLGTLELSKWELFVLLQAAGCATALAFRNTITEASVGKSVVLGLTLPLFALYVFIVLMLVGKLAAGTLGGGDIGASFVYGPFFLVSFGYVTFPLGIISQFIMRWAGAAETVPARPPEQRPDVE